VLREDEESWQWAVGKKCSEWKESAEC
jgi:hypothetical protein